VWEMLIVCAVLLGVVGVVTGQTRNAFLAGILLLVGAVASLAYALQIALGLAAEAVIARSRRGQHAGFGAERRSVGVLRFIVVSWELMFVVFPLFVTALSIRQAIRAFTQWGTTEG